MPVASGSEAMKTTVLICAVIILTGCAVKRPVANKPVRYWLCQTGHNECNLVEVKSKP